LLTSVIDVNLRYYSVRRENLKTKKKQKGNSYITEEKCCVKQVEDCQRNKYTTMNS
jgi:hypothetical protein